jgi:transcriptional regulator with XRE-family HTH domain
VTGSTLREARRERGWTQQKLADGLGISQAYVCLLERGRRTVPRRLDEAPRALGALGYPGFAHMSGRQRLNPAELLLRVLRARQVDSRVVEALPWMLLRYPDLNWPWLLREARANDLQNRLGFLLGVAGELAALWGEQATARTLAAQERALEGSRLEREDTFRDSMTEAERRWLHEHRPARAAHWNMLSTMTASELVRAS